jgi:methylase of polypeptide subunit release factors
MKIKCRSSIKEGGGTIWDAAYVLIHFFHKQPQGFLEYSGLDASKTYNVIEVGSGTGIAGIGMAKALKKSNFYLTEMSPGSLELMKENVALNSLDP